MIGKLKTFLRRFSGDTGGSVAVEAAVILPVLLWAMVAMWVFFDAYRTRSTTEKAAFTISDMLSRETNAIDDAYLDGAKNLLDLLARSDSASGLRVTVISYSGANKSHALEWSKTRGNMQAMDGSAMNQIVGDLPTMSDGETMILVETLSTYEPALKVGLGDQVIKTFVFTRPRFAPQLVWES
ncbi:TadE/TadG family type IV pilus assembly protein [Shimia sp.]|uniref:TadE/TadG family type IV pilus assembly protein n=1 Tax=Shimia sp. TaxID=1954381 RepID=UPI003565C1A6